ncbi:MAG: alpha-galactosidase [Chitinophagaceae bacterium BSSC1]|nr:MAG: alpha-galactosidase [Chitinophagaceae bacterium BSSC1]
MRNRVLLLAVLFIFANTLKAQESKVWLDDLNLPGFNEAIPSAQAKMSTSGDSIQLLGKRFQHGVGVQSTSILYFLMEGKARKFTATIGVDDKSAKELAVEFFVIGDKKILFQSGTMKLGDAPKQVSVSLDGIQRLGLLVLPKEEMQRSHTNWANAQFVMLGNSLPKNIPNSDEKYILTPPVAKAPRINSPKVFGARPGNPFLFTVVATGEAPIQYSVSNLPKGLSIDSKTGIITGVLSSKATYAVTMKASNKYGKAEKPLLIKIGDTISLTPPIGWNGWNSWAREIDKEKVVASAKAMVSMGLSSHGWTYINIDDAWQGQRGGKYNALQANEKFPDFKKMIDEIHGMGLKLGVYSTPWISSYAGYPGGSSNFENGAYPDSVRANKRAYRYTGKYRFEKEDARQMAEWGVDYLKYDWRIDVKAAEAMSVAIRNAGRDIIYSLSNSAPFSNVQDWVRLAEAWRTGPDIRDSWQSLYVSAFTLDKWGPYGGPGHWNDPDMMILGNVTTGAKLHPTRLTADEQYSHVSLFSLLAAPLLIGCPIEQLDAFTLNLLTNDEVIEIDQDPLGKSARLVLEENDVQVWLKPLENGAYALGMFNINGFRKTPQSFFRWGDEQPKQYDLDLNKLGLKGKWLVRDVWKQKNLGSFQTTIQNSIRHHGVVMLKLTPTK